MKEAETKTEYIIRAKASLRQDLRAKSWPEKIRSIERMNEAQRKARASTSAFRQRRSELVQPNAQADPGPVAK